MDIRSLDRDAIQVLAIAFNDELKGSQNLR